MRFLRIPLALAILFLIVLPRANATPDINNQTQPVPEVHTATEVVQPTIQSEAPTPEPQPVPVESEQEIVPPNNDPKSQARATLIDLGYGDAWYAVEYIGFKESSWNPTAVNSIGACGLFQALPCEKMPCVLSDVPCQVRWATNYAVQRYGSWHQAYNFWRSNNWW